MADYQTLKVEDDGPVRIVTINRPDVLNALNETVIAEFTEVLESLATVGAGPRGLLVTGAGKAFVAGADIAAMADLDPERALAFAGRGQALGEMLVNLPIPTLAAVNGFALGGGCELAMACDFIYASEHAKFGQPEVNLGVIPGFGGTQRMSRRVGPSRALELCMTGEMLRADEALRIGLVNRVLPAAELVSASVATLKTIASKGPLAIAKVKELIHRGASMRIEDACDMEEREFAALFATEDQKEGMAAFLAKRPAQFKGR